MTFLVLSHQHGLAPFAWTLRSEDADVTIGVEKPRYAAAWEGRLKALPVDRKGFPEPVLAALKEGELTVLTDSPKLTAQLREEGAKRLYGRPRIHKSVLPPLRIGSWFDGEQHVAKHLLVADRGLFPGGLGFDIEAGLTLVSPMVWPQPFDELLASLSDELKSEGHRGLVQVGLQYDGSTWGIEGWEAGWSWLQSHAFISQQTNLTGVLSGSVEPNLPTRFTVVVPVSVAPWPLPCSNANIAPNVPMEIPLPETADGRRLLTQNVYFHDVVVKEGSISTAGLDGLVGVAKGSALNVELARKRALGVAGALRLPGVQTRVDVGGSVGAALATLEDQGTLL